MRNTVDILGVPVDKVTMEEALKMLESFLDNDRVNTIYTPNSEIIMAAYRNQEFGDILRQGDMVIPDGAGVVLASKILGVGLPERVAGFDLTSNSFMLDSKKPLRFFLLGGKPGIAESAAEKILNAHPGIEIAGCRHGYFSQQDEDAIIEQINSSNSDILLVAFGAPKQEMWIHRHKNRLKVKVCIGIGGALDVLSGQKSPAPDFFRNNGLEWLYRLYKEPWRFKRMLDLPRFIMLALWKRLFK